MNLSDLPQSFNQKIRFLDRSLADLARGDLSAKDAEKIFEALNAPGADLDAVASALYGSETLIVSRSRPIIAPPFARYWARFNVPAKAKKAKPGQAPSSKPLGSQMNLTLFALDAAPSDDKVYPAATWRETLRNPPLSRDPGATHRVYPASRRGLRKGDAAAVVCAWAEIDSAPDPARPISSQWERVERSVEFLGPVSICDYSGGKSLHVFWLFDEPFELNSAEDVARFERVEKLLALALGGDPAVSDISHEMRTPGFCGADFAGRIRIQPALVFDPESRVSFAEFEAAVEEFYRAERGEEPPAQERRERRAPRDPRNLPAPAIIAAREITARDREKIERSIAAFAAARPGDRPSRQDRLNTAIACAARTYKSEGKEIELPSEIEEAIINAAEICEYIPDHATRATLSSRLVKSWDIEQSKAEVAPLRTSELIRSLAAPSPGAVAPAVAPSAPAVASKRMRRTLEGIEGIEIREFKGKKTNKGAGWVVSPDQELATFNLFTAQCGEGKSEACKALIEQRRAKNPDLRAAWIVARKSLGEITANERKSAYYLKKNKDGGYTDEPRRDWSRRNSKDVVITINSLHRLANVPPPEILIIDEFTEIFAAVMMSGSRSKIYESFQVLRTWFETAERDGRTIIACDAIAEKPSIENLRDLCGGHLRAFVEPLEVQALKGKTISVIQESELPSLIFDEMIEPRPFALFEMTKTTAKNIRDFAAGLGRILRPGYLTEVFTAENKLSAAVARSGLSLEEFLSALNAWFFNGTIASGVSDKSGHFKDAIVLIGKYGYLSEHDREQIQAGFRVAIQAALRSRGVERIFIVEPEKDFAGLAEEPQFEEIEGRIQSTQERHLATLSSQGEARYLLGDREFFARFEARERESIYRAKINPVLEILRYAEEEGAKIEPPSFAHISLFDGIKLRSKREKEITLARWFSQNNTRAALRREFELAISKSVEEVNSEEAVIWTRRGYETPPETRSPAALAMLAALYLGYEEDAKRFDFAAMVKEGVIDPTKKRSPLETAQYLRDLLGLLDPDFGTKIEPLIISGLTGLSHSEILAAALSAKAGGEMTPAAQALAAKAPEPLRLEGPRIDSRQLATIRRRADLDPITARTALREVLIPLRDVLGDAITARPAKIRGVKQTVVSIDYARAAELIIQISPDFRRVLGAEVDPLPIESFVAREASDAAVRSFERRREEVESRAEDIRKLFESAAPPPVAPVASPSAPGASPGAAAARAELAFALATRPIFARSSKLRAEWREVCNLGEAWIKIHEKFPQLEGENLKRA